MPQFQKSRSASPGAALSMVGQLPPEIALKVRQVPAGGLRTNPRNSRRHSPKQITQIGASIQRFGFLSPILIDEDGVILAGHGRHAAAVQLGLAAVPIIQVDHLTEAERRAFMIADNRLAELSRFDDELLSLELKELDALDLDFPLEITGFEGARLDALLDPSAAPEDPDDKIPETSGPPVTRLGDLWRLGDHRLLCGDARMPASYETLMRGDRARLIFTDPPYNVPIDGHVGGNGKVARRDFVMGAGELSDAEFEDLLNDALKSCAGVTVDGGIHYVCMDWRSIDRVVALGRAAYSEFKNLIVWVKDNGGLGTFYRSQHELIAVFKVGRAPHTNNFGLGETGRYRTNVWTYPGANSFGKGRDQALALHPTVKPVALVADAIKDVSRRREIVLDPFAGSGTTLIAAQRTGRRARLLELDPLYCDTICRRWAAFYGQEPMLDPSGEPFSAVSEARAQEAANAEA